MQNTKDNKEAVTKHTIEGFLVMPLKELASYFYDKEEEDEKIIELLDNEPKKASKLIKKLLLEIIGKKKLPVKIKKVAFDVTDSSNLSHGAAHFIIKLEGERKDLKRIAGEGKVIEFYWK